MKAEGECSVFEDGTPFRFWGTNLNAGACFPEKPYAEKLAKRLAAYGCNIVRLHQMDAEWGMPNIYRFRRGKRLANTLSYDAEGFFVGQCPIRYENGYAVFNIGGEASSIYSFIQAE